MREAKDPGAEAGLADQESTLEPLYDEAVLQQQEPDLVCPGRHVRRKEDFGPEQADAGGGQDHFGDIWPEQAGAPLVPDQGFAETVRLPSDTGDVPRRIGCSSRLSAPIRNFWALRSDTILSSGPLAATA